LDTIQHPEVDTKRNLTCQKDREIALIDFCGAPFNSKAANPYPDQTPNKILTRQYLVSTINITPEWTGSYLAFPGTLFEIEAIKQALSTFYYFHSDIRIMLKLSSTVYQQGMVLVSFVHDVLYVPNLAPIEYSQYSPVTMNISTSDSVEIEHHWMAPQLYVNTPQEEVTTEVAAIGYLAITPLVPIANLTGSTTTATLQVFAQFKNPVVAGYTVPSATTRKRKTAEAQSMEAPANTAPQGITPEAHKKNDTGQMVLATAGVLAPLFRSIPVIGDVYTTIATAVKTVADILDKPRDTKIPMRMANQGTVGWTHGAGLDSSNRFSLYPGSNLARPPVDKTCLSTDHTVNQLAMKPALHHWVSWTESASTVMIGVHPGFNGSFNAQEPVSDVVNLYMDPLMKISSFHYLWRGSIRYFFQFITNAFTVARFRISYHIAADAYSPIGGDFPSQIIEVKGTTEISFLVPYLWNTVWRRTFIGIASSPGYEQNCMYPYILVELLNNPSGIGASSQIDMIVWRAAGPDIQFSEVIGQEPESIFRTTTEKKVRKAQGQCSIEQKFTENFKPIGCDCSLTMESGYTTSETTGRAIDVLRRVYPLDFQTLFNWPNTQAVSQIALPILANCFRYQRGTIRVVSAVENTTSGGQEAIIRRADYPYTLSQGQHVITSCATEVLFQQEVAWNQTIPYVETAGNSTLPATQYPTQTIVSTQPITQQWMSAGEDFYMFYWRAPPPMAYSIPTRQKQPQRAPPPLQKVKES
jgi:hypothetical protein